MTVIDRLCDGTSIPVARAIKPVVAIPQTIAATRAFEQAETADTLIIIITIDDRLYDRINDVRLLRLQQRYLFHQQLVAIKRIVLLALVVRLALIGLITQTHQTAIKILINNAKVKVQTVAIPRRSVLSIKFQIALCITSFIV